ncbi:MAG: KAP family NTPase, partial [Candidatus Obscuribacterales bacterium]|nr:KAP family NTPase [Candidatus Obscuribacterales bacterium]
MPAINFNIGSASKEPDKEPEDILSIAKNEELNDVPRIHQERELDLLIDRLDKDRIGHVKDTVARIKELANRLEVNERLPYTFGIFGGWGSGKTFVLAHLAKELNDESHKVVYFNAFTYASHLDLTTSLVYRILRAAKPDGGLNKVLHQVNAISRVHAKPLYQKCVLPAKLIRSAREFTRNVSSDRQLKIASDYFGKIDKIHRNLAKSLKSQRGKPIYVLIDELDRCDPEEAFGAIKQLRMLLNAPDLPLFFILGVNPEPIGKYLQKKFGLEEHDSYESISILEKFVDGSINLPPQREIGKFIEHRLSQYGLIPEKFYPTILRLQSRNGQMAHLPPGIGALPLFSNLRLISKTLEALSYAKPSNNLYSNWVWDLMQVSNPSLAATARKLADEMEELADRSHGRLASYIHRSGSRYYGEYSNPNSNLFDFYCEIFKSELTDLAQRLLKRDQGVSSSLLSTIASNTASVYSLAHLSCVDVGEIETKHFEGNGDNLRYSELVPTK